MRYIIIFVLAFGFVVSLSAQKESRAVKEGNKLYLAKKFEEAQKRYQDGISKNQKSIPSNFNYGNSLFRQKKYKEANEQFSKTATLTTDKKESSAIFHNMGTSYLHSKEYAKSIEAYKKALKANPNDDDTRYNLAVAQHLLKKQQQHQQQNEQQQDKKDNKQQEQNKDKNKDKNEDKQQNEQQSEMDKEKAEQILQALEQDEQDTQKKRKIKMGRRAKVEKQW